MEFHIDHDLSQGQSQLSHEGRLIHFLSSVRSKITVVHCLPWPAPSSCGVAGRLCVSLFSSHWLAEVGCEFHLPAAFEDGHWIFLSPTRVCKAKKKYSNAIMLLTKNHKLRQRYQNGALVLCLHFSINRTRQVCRMNPIWSIRVYHTTSLRGVGRPCCNLPLQYSISKCGSHVLLWKRPKEISYSTNQDCAVLLSYVRARSTVTSGLEPQTNPKPSLVVSND